MIPGVGKIPLEKGKATHPLQYSGLQNPVDCMVCGVAKSLTQLSDFHLDTLLIFIIIAFILRCTMPLSGSNFPDQGLNPRPMA